MNISQRFDQFDDDFLKFERIENKRNRRKDLHAFLLLDELDTREKVFDIIHSAEHDIIYLDIPEEIIETFTDEQILELVRCGVMYTEYEDLSMYV